MAPMKRLSLPSSLGVAAWRAVGRLLPIVGVGVLPTPAIATPALPVSAPATALRVHARSLDATLQALRTYLPIPLKPEAAMDSLLGPLGSQVVLSAPVDVVVALDRQSVDSPAPPQWVFACGLRSLDEARKIAAQANLPMEPQGKASRLLLKSGGDTWRCLLGADGGTGARLACGQSERSQVELAPYALTLPPLPIKSDLRAELSVQTVVQTYDGLWQRGLQMAGLLVPQKLQLGNPVFDRGLTDLTQALVGQVGSMAKDLQTISVDISLGGAGAEAVLAYQLNGHDSWWGQADARAAQQPPTAIPAAFWSLPKDVGSGSFTVSEVRYAQQLLQLLQPVLDGFLTHDGLAQADRQAIVDLLKVVPLTDGPVSTVVAELPPPPGLESQPRAERPDLGQLLAGRAYLMTSDGVDERPITWLKNIVAAYKRPGVQAYLRARWKKLGLPEPLPVVRLQPANKALGPGALQFTVSASVPALLEKAGLGRANPTAKAKAQPLVLHLLTGKQAGRTWMALGSDADFLSKRLAEQLTLPTERSLSQRPGLEGLQQPGLRSGGFTSLRSLSRYLDSALSLSRLRGGRGADSRTSPSDIAQLFNMLPHHGETSIVHSSRVRAMGQAGSNPPLISEWTVRVPRTALEDVVAMVMHLAM